MAGINSAARMAMIEMTTRSSTRVKASFSGFTCETLLPVRRTSAAAKSALSKGVAAKLPILPPHFAYINRIDRAVVLNVFVHDFVSIKVYLNHTYLHCTMLWERLQGQKEPEYRLNDFVRPAGGAVNDVLFMSLSSDPPENRALPREKLDALPREKLDALPHEKLNALLRECDNVNAKPN